MKLVTVNVNDYKTATAAFMWTSLCMHGAGYHDGFVIPAGATNIQITEDPVNPNVYLGEHLPTNIFFIHPEMSKHLQII